MNETGAISPSFNITFNRNIVQDDDSPDHFLPGVPVSIRITEANYTPKSHTLHPYLYTINVTHGMYKWTLKRRFDKIHELHTKLKMARTAMAIRNIDFHTKKVGIKCSCSCMLQPIQRRWRPSPTLEHCRAVCPPKLHKTFKHPCPLPPRPLESSQCSSRGWVCVLAFGWAL